MTTTATHKPIPGAAKYEINISGAVRNVKQKSPVFENQAGDLFVTNDKGEKIKVDSSKLVKELFGVDMKKEKLTAFQKDKLKKEKQKEVKPVKAVKVKVVKEKKAKPTKEAKKSNSITTTKYKEGDSITFSPRWKKHRDEGIVEVTGTITRIFKGGDGNDYVKIKVGEKSYLKQVKSL